MEIIRNEDGTLLVPVPVERLDLEDEEIESGEEPAPVEQQTRVLHPGEGGYDEALAEWDREQNPDREAAVSTASGREEAMRVVRAVADSHATVADAVAALADPEASAEALRHVLVGGVHAVEDFASEAAEAEGSEPLPAHEATKIIGEVLAELD